LVIRTVLAVRAADLISASGNYVLADSARFRAHRFFVAAMIAFLPAAESLRLRLGAGSGVDGSAAFLDAAYLSRWAAAIARLPAALILRRLGFGASGVGAVSAGPPDSVARG